MLTPDESRKWRKVAHAILFELRSLNNRRNERPSNTWMYIRFAVEALGLGAAIFLTCLTYGTLNEVKNQTKLMRRQLIDTFHAEVILEAGVENNSGYFNMPNIGKIAAKDVMAEVTFTKQRLPDLQAIGSGPTTIKIGPRYLRPVGPNGEQESARIFDLTPQDVEAIADFREAIKIEWRGSFNNGFDETVILPTECKIYFANRMGSQPGVIKCVEFQASFTAAKRARDQNQQKQ